MPFACSAGQGTLQVAPANDTAYRILGSRDEQPFVACRRPGGAQCETMMVHRFAIECDGQRVAWSRVANAARASGIALPAGLPAGFAPVSSMSGRFVLPALTRTSPYTSQVATQDLSPDSVIEMPDDHLHGTLAAWDTTVRADMSLASPGGTAARVGGSIAAVLALLLSASMIAAGRWRIPALDVESLLRLRAGDVAQRAGRYVKSLQWTWPARQTPALDTDLANAFSIVQARLIQAELSVAALAPDMLLRDVLTSEVAALRQRLADAGRQAQSRTTEKTSNILRSLLRDLERICRISQSAAQGAQPPRDDDQELPLSTADAYRVLGINAEAAPAVAKKLVDALRMSWHPDHARDEPDRQRREARMKQINAAWDLIKHRRAAA